MTRLNLHLPCLTLLAAVCAAGQGAPAPQSFAIAGRQLTMLAPAACAAAQPPRQNLARFLNQYDPSGEPRGDGVEDTPLHKKEIALTKKGLVEQGFHTPDGQDSVITWMDFDADGACDFTASAGVGGMRSVDRMFLFRGMGKGQFQLVDAYHNFMESSIIVVPYLPLAVAGEKLPLLVKNDNLLMWQSERKQFASCDAIARARVTGEVQPVPPLLTALCPHVRTIYGWAAGQLPHRNEVPYAGAGVDP